MPKTDAKKDFDDAYNQSVEKWWPWWNEAKKDIKMKLGDQYNESDKTRLKKQEHKARVFNRCRRMANLLSGWERRNRLGIKVDAEEGADRATAEQLSGVVQYAWQRAQAYQTISAAYEKGPVTCGLNLVELYLDYRQDPLNGDLRFARLPFNRFLLDPYFTNIDLTDCNYLLTRDWLSMAQLNQMFPGKDKELQGLRAGGRDQKFPDVKASKDFKGKNLFRVDRFFRRDTAKTWYLVDKQTGLSREFPGKKAEMEAKLGEVIPQLGLPYSHFLDPVEAHKSVVKLAMFVEDEEFYDDDDPMGLDDFPMVPMLGYFEPESDDWRHRLCGVMRDMRDPQIVSNQRRMKFLDVMDNFIDSLAVRKGALVNPKSAYQRGPAVWWLNDDAEIGKDLQVFRGGGAFPGLMEAIQMFDKDIEEVPGGNETLMGLPNKDDAQEAWIMGKLRMQAGLTIFEPLMDNHRQSIRELGHKTIKAIQTNYPPHKVQRILNKPPSQLFFNPDFSQYQVQAVQGLLTESQRQLRYAQLMALKQAQFAIPDSMILEASDLEMSAEFLEGLKQKEKMQQQLMMQKIQQEMALSQATIKKESTKAQLQEAQAIKIMADVKGIPEDRMMKLIELATDLEAKGHLSAEGPQQLAAPITTR